MERPKILVADDEEVIRDLFETFLGKQGYSVSTASDGFEAVDKIKKDNYDMLILDLKMPGMDGMSVLNKIRELKKELVIVVITGYATVDTAKEAIKQGCFDYITKPFDIEDVSIVIRRAIEVRRLAEEKKKFQEQVQTAERLRALAQMGAGVAHEVNTVLTAIKLFLEMLKPKLPPMKEGKNIDLVLEEVERAERLIDRFLEFSKPAETEFLKTDINKIINRSLQFLKYRFKRQKIKVSNESSKALPKISCDPTKMEEVFLNIFSNSIDAMPKGGLLTIKSEVSDKKIALIISDTGVGIPSENMQKLYNPFFTTKPHGTGLGLSIVYRIIDEHKGTITITSEKEKGTTVRVELPINKVESSEEKAERKKINYKSQ